MRRWGMRQCVNGAFQSGGGAEMRQLAHFGGEVEP